MEAQTQDAIPQQTQSYAQAYDTLNRVTETLAKLDGRDLDQLLPLLEQAESAHRVVRDRIDAIMASPLLAKTDTHNNASN